MNIEEKIGYKFKNREYLNTAITHSSFAHEIASTDYNERIEYLGDAVLELISSEYIYNTYPKLTEGEMTKARAYAVCEDSLARVANKYSFSDFLHVGKCEAKIDGRYRASILADSIEAVIGAIFLDSGIESAKEFILPNILPRIQEFIEEGNRDYKTQLQERVQARGEVKIEYNIVNMLGPEHDKVFVAEVSADGKVLGSGEGKSKKEAEMNAAKIALQTLKNMKW